MVESAGILGFGMGLIQFLLIVLIGYNLVKLFGTFSSVKTAAEAVGGGLGGKIRKLFGEEQETAREERQTARAQRLAQKEEKVENLEERETIELEKLSKSDIDGMQRLGTQLTAVRDELNRVGAKEDIERIYKAVGGLGSEVVHFGDAEKNVDRHIKELENFIGKELRFEGKSQNEIKKLANEVLAELKTKKKVADIGVVEERLTQMMQRSTQELKAIEEEIQKDVVNLHTVQTNLDSIAREMNVEFKTFLEELGRLRGLQAITVESKNPALALVHRLINNTARAFTTFQQRLNYIHDAEKAEQRKKEILNAVKVGFLRLKGFEQRELAEEKKGVKAAKIAQKEAKKGKLTKGELARAERIKT